MIETRRFTVSGQGETGPARAEARVSIRNLSKTYRTRRGAHVALDNVSLDIGASEFVVLLGPSGCGKTTLLRCVAGLEEPDAGEILINGQLVFSSEKGISVPPEKRPFNMVFQSYALWPHMTVQDNVAYPLRNAGRAVRAARESAGEALRLVGLGDYLAAYPGQLSGGQQQRVALARAIVSGDGLILFDEPLSNLDAKVRERLRLELLGLQSRIGFAAIYVTHDQVEALALADRIAVMDVGRIEQVGTSDEIYDAPRSRYVSDFVGSANELPGRIVSVGETVVVDTPMGRMEGGFGGEPVAVGADAWVMFRPEHCQFDFEPGCDGENRLDGEVLRSLYLGASMQHVVGSEDRQIVVTRTGGGPLEPGTDVTVCCPVGRVRIFPGDTGR
ncbi:ATP-binding cassette domain-containing protein [Rhodobacterales bacterium HKCCE2091]|nr:ATP-binding cassette domain-containing protein [Rhodobacterales bacterium HKCCE2091]